jgi:pimeloyl-ACP methyl ester carboxylesterase
MKPSTQEFLPSAIISTDLGLIPLWGEFETFAPDRPLVFVVQGAFAERGLMRRLYRHLPECDVVLAHLPGMNTPHLKEITIPAFARAYDEVLAKEFSNRRVLRVGLSIGGLVTFAMRQGHALVAVDPPFQTGPLWPLLPRLHVALAQQSDAQPRQWLWNIFGVSESSTVDRDYRYLVAANSVPAIVLVGGDPLEPERETNRFPGFLTAEARKLLTDSDRVQTIIIEGAGHNIPRDAPFAFLEGIRAGLAQIALPSGDFQ